MTSWDQLRTTARILLVDDMRATLRLLERMLGKAGYVNVRSTTRADEVLSLYRQERPDLILLDLHMPGVNGLDLLDQLHEEIGPGDYLPIMVVTGDTTHEAKLQALTLGAKDFLVKPVDTIETMLKIRILLETRALFLELARDRLGPDAIRPGQIETGDVPGGSGSGGL